MDRADRAKLWGDAACAVALAAVLTLGWSLVNWADLRQLRLPDTDDIMRLQQIRDWIGGQAFGDLSQHRLAGGLPMHWSRLPDLVPGALIALLTPLFGSHAAELTAVILWPGALLAVAVFLVARIARQVGGDRIARTAAVVAAIAYPATTIFLPGRIDHHGLQVVLLLVLIDALVAAPTRRRGAIAGVAAAASLLIGMETAPLLAAAGLVMAIDWLCGSTGSDRRLVGFGLVFAGTLLAGAFVLHPLQWRYPACDGFTANLWHGAMIASLAPIALGSIRSATVRVRAVWLAGIGGMTGLAVAWAAPTCLSPYGMVDPWLARWWLANVAEAQPLLAMPADVMIGYGGVILAGILAGAWCWRTTRDPRWAGLLLIQIASLALALVQLRGAYAGAMLAAPALAAVIAAARARGSVALAGAWIASAGMLYPIAAAAIVPKAQRGMPSRGQPGDCRDPRVFAALARLPTGRVIAPVDLGPDILARTPHAVLAAPYHRDNAGNLASYRFFLGDPARTQEEAATWHIEYVLLCRDSFSELGLAAGNPRHLATQLEGGQTPRWLRAVPLDTNAAMLYAVTDPRLPR